MSPPDPQPKRIGLLLAVGIVPALLLALYATAFGNPALWRSLFGGAVCLVGLRIAWPNPELTPGLALRRAFQTLALCLAGYYFTAPWYTNGRLLTTAAIWAAAFGVALALQRFVPRTRLGSFVDVALTNVAVFVALAELLLRLLSAFSNSPFLQPVDAESERVIEINRYEPGTMRMGFPTNSWGHYDDEFERRAEGEQLIAMIGDSFSAGVVPHAYHFSTLVEERLGVPVANFGLPALGPWEYAILARDEVAGLDPTAVVVQLFVGNDIRETLARAPQDKSRLARWFDPDALLLVKLPQRWSRILRATRSQNGGVLHPDDTPVAGDLEAAYPWLADPMLEQQTFREEVFLEIERTRAEELTALGEGATVLAVAALLQARDANPGAPFFVVLIPDELQVEDGLWQKVGADLPRASNRWRAQKLLARRLSAEGIPFLDLLPVFRQVEPLPDGDRHLYLLHDSHLNARGNRVAADAIATFLASRLDWLAR